MANANLEKLLQEARKKPETVLRSWQQYTQGNNHRIVADTELERRRQWHNFLTHGIVGWLSLIVSIGALVVAVIALWK